MSRIHQTALVGLLLLVLFSVVGFSQVLLLHGWLGDGSNWNECIRIMTAAPYDFDSQRILSPSLPNDVSLVDWTVNIATYINSLPEDVKFTVVAHSFGGTSILFLLVVAHHVGQGDLAQWVIGLNNQDPNLSPIIDALLSLADPNLFVRAARRVQKVFLYHPALGGGCYACSACGEIPILLLCDDSLRDMCSLEMGKELIFEKDDVTALNIPSLVSTARTHGALAPASVLQTRMVACQSVGNGCSYRGTTIVRWTAARSVTLTLSSTCTTPPPTS